MKQTMNTYQYPNKNQRLIDDQDRTNGSKPAKRSFSGQTMMVTGLCFVMLLIVGIPLYKSYNQLQANQEVYQQAQAENRQAVENNRLIQREYQKFNDPEYLEEIARRDYYYSKDGEIIFVLPEEESSVNY